MKSQINIESVATLTKEQLCEAIITYLQSGNINVTTINDVLPMLDQRNEVLTGVRLKLTLGGRVMTPTTNYRTSEG